MQAAHVDSVDEDLLVLEVQGTYIILGRDFIKSKGGSSVLATMESYSTSINGPNIQWRLADLDDWPTKVELDSELTWKTSTHYSFDKQSTTSSISECDDDETPNPTNIPRSSPKPKINPSNSDEKACPASGSGTQ
jgi:hypothetical protein